MYILGKMSKDRWIAEDGDVVPSGRSDSALAEDFPKPRTLTVLGLLALTAVTFSYLGAYASYNALISAQVIERFQGPDPRPRWLLTGFCVLMLVFMSAAEIFRRLSSRDLRAIDAMAEAEDRHGESHIY